MDKIKLELRVDPLGDLFVQWSIPVACIDTHEINIDLPTYKYEMSNFSGVPIPIASIAEGIVCEVFGVKLDNSDLPFEIIKNWLGRTTLKISLETMLTSQTGMLTVRYIVKGIVTKDKVFFNFVFTIASPLPKAVSADIDLTAHFAYHISHHRLKAVAISEMTGRIVTNTGLIRHKRIGDFIYGTGRNVYLETNGTLDLHVHGSRLPVAIDRRYFWIIVYLITLLGIGGLITVYTFLVRYVLRLF